QLEDLALHVHRDLLGQVALGHGGGHVGDVTHLAGQVAGHEVHVVGQVLPHAGDAGHLGLAAQLSFRTHLAGDAGHLGGETADLIAYGVYRVFQLEDLALDIHGDFARQVAVGHGRGDGGDVADLGRQVAGHEVHGVGEVLPRTGDALDLGLAAE